LGLRRPYFFLSTLAHRLNFVVGVTLGLRWSYSFASTLAHHLNFVVGPTLALLLDVDVRPSFEFRRWPNHYGCVGQGTNVPRNESSERIPDTVRH